MKVFSFLIILIVSIILSSKIESEAFVWNNWFCDWITNKNNNGETTTTLPPVTDTQIITSPAPVVANNNTETVSITKDEKMQAISNISSSINKFSLELHKAMGEKTNGSFISSPLSAAMVLMMAAYGARSENADRMNYMLHFDTNNNIYKKGIYSLIKMFDALNPIGFKLANKIYAGKDQEIKSDFKSLVSSIFKSSIEEVDFGLSEDTKTKMNNWRAEKDHQRITNVIESDEISADTDFFFINSLYFSALWKTAFNETNTELIKFNINKEETIKQPIMYIYNKSKIGHNVRFGVDYMISDFKRDSDDDELMRFIILFPDHDFSSIELIEESLPELNLSDFDEGSKTFDVCVPKVRVESTINFEDMFDQLGTNFSSISKQGSELKMSMAVQKFILEINESGIKAAVHSGASFANKTGSSGPPLKQDPIFNNKSSIFFITYNNTILFTGRFIGN